MILVGGRTYELVREHKNAWNADAFKERYSDVLDRYDYIVGDWGYNQLRLKGFFKEGSPKATKETTIASLQDYLQEYCNFGCAYFVLERAAGKGAAAPGGAPAVRSDTSGAVDEGLPDAVRTEAQGASVLASGHAFSERKPYSWREHQSPSRLSGRSGTDRKDSSAAETPRDAVVAEPSVGERAGGQQARSRGEASTSASAAGANRQPEGGKARHELEGAAQRFTLRSGERANAAGNDAGGNEPGEKHHRGGRKFHHKGQKGNNANRSRGGGPSNRQEAGPGSENGNRPEGRRKTEAEGGSNRHSHRNNNHNRPALSQQSRNNQGK